MDKESIFISSPLGSIHLNDKSYVTALASHPSAYVAASSTPANTIRLYDKSDLRKQISVLPGHTRGISSLSVAKNFMGLRDVLMTCGKDGVVKIWDERSGASVVESVFACRSIYHNIDYITC